MKKFEGYPFAAVVGQEKVKKALLLVLVNSRCGSLLIGGRRGTAKSVTARGAEEVAQGRRFFTLPLSITEDMLLGSLDLERTLQKGVRAFAPGLLSRADGNILYVDDINLLRREVLAAVQTVHAAGVNTVEREGLSHREEISFTLIGTMDPAEGTFPGTVLDRFGLYVETEDMTDVKQRAEVIRRALSFAGDPGAFRKKFAKETAELQRQLERAQQLLPRVEVPEAMLELTAQMCARALCAGHRAELYLLEAGKAAAALAGRTFVLPADLDEAALFVLPHRMGRSPQAQQQLQEENDDSKEEEEKPENRSETQKENEEESAPQLPSQNKNREADGSKDKEDNENEEEKEKEEDPHSQESPAPADETAAPDKNFPPLQLLVAAGRSRQERRGSGKRSLTRTSLKQGRYVRAELPGGEADDIALDATIRAAAPWQRWREPQGCALTVWQSDLRQKVREQRIGNTFLFAVDASGSMGAWERMRAVKGAVLQLLREAYQKRDRVGLLAFRRDRAEVLLPFTHSIELAQKALVRLPTGGKTPLAEGLTAALTMIAQGNKAQKEQEPVLILVTDGRANARSGATEPVAAALKAAERIRRAKIKAAVIDTERDFIKLGIAQKVAAAMGASYHPLRKLSQEGVLRIVENLEGEL